MGWSSLLVLAARRHGVVTIADAAAHGVSRASLRRRAGREPWLSLHPGIYLVAGARDTPLARHVAATLATDGVLARASALWLHGLRESPPHPPRVVVPAGRVGSRAGNVEVRRSRTLDPALDVCTVGGLPTTVMARTAADLAGAGWSVPRLRRLVIDAERSRLLGRTDLIAVHERLRPGTPGRGTLGRVLAELDGMRSDSDTEHDVRRELADRGYPVHHEPFPFRCDDGVDVHLDVALPSCWVYVEVDGFGDHGRRPVFETDRVRWTQVVRHWRPVWVTWQRWHEDRNGVLRDLDAAIALADPSRPPARPADRPSEA